MAPSKISMYIDDYVKFGFTFIEKNDVRKLQCIVCHVVLSNDTIRPSRLGRHLTTVHPTLKCRPKEYFAAKKISLSKIKLDSTG